ncbi:MAG: type I 3-dehydroquinate dehydratase [Clostridium sp.]|nr:type I 3-dehydroquinate dehydratase [Clostridium sp.]
MSFVEIKGKKIGVGSPKICVSVMGQTEEELLRQINTLQNNQMIDIVEIRADYFQGLGRPDEVERLMTAVQSGLSEKIVLFTMRSEKEGGQRLPSDIMDIDGINRLVISSKLADIVDIELSDGASSKRELVELAHANAVKIIMSYHNFDTTPESEFMTGKLEAMKNMGADIIKIAVMPKTIHDVYRLMEAATDTKERFNVPLVAISMGAFGAITRISGALYGSDITFGALERASAPGQIPVSDLKRMMDDIERYCM